MEGTQGFFASTESEGWAPVGAQRSLGSFVKDLTVFLKAFKNSGGDNKKLIAIFISTMQNVYGITVTYTQ